MANVISNEAYHIIEDEMEQHIVIYYDPTAGEWKVDSSHEDIKEAVDRKRELMVRSGFRLVRVYKEI